MTIVKKSPFLRQVILRLILLRLLLPLLVLGLIATAGVGYLGKKNLEIQQYKVAQSIAHTVDYHLEHGGRILDAVARTAESSGIESLSTFMENTWEAYGYFDTLYYLDGENKIKILIPYDPRYTGLDMSNMPDLKQVGKKKKLIISRPFVSLRTGEPTVYLIRPLSQRGCVVGELNLGSLQKEITKTRSMSDKSSVFIMDQFGKLLAHPCVDLVQQQANLSNLEIFQRGMSGEAHAVYPYNKTWVLGSAVRIERTGWIIVDQVPVSVFLSTYAWTIGLIFFVSLIIWLTLVWDLRKQLHRSVITPLEQLNRGTNALTVGDFSQVNSLAAIPAAFAELNELTKNFLFMSSSLQMREAKIKQQQELLLEGEQERRAVLEKELIMKDEFISLISHEFKTPLNVIYSAIQLIEGIYFNEIPERVKELIGNIKQNTFRQLRLANNLLDITRLNSGQYKLNMKNIDIVFLTKVITESVKLYANQKNIALSFESDMQCKHIYIDDEKYERIILNLLSNAIKFTDQEGKITVILNEIGRPDMVQIKIKDTGIGIPKDKQEIIFERFGQVDSNLSRRAEGTGIGLSLVKLLVDVLEGTIEVESEPGTGSTFTITLPVKEVETENECAACQDVDNRLVSEIRIQFSDIYF
ncbi:MAG: ATP-binding protein [Bacillota bacterium]